MKTSSTLRKIVLSISLAITCNIAQASTKHIVQGSLTDWLETTNTPAAGIAVIKNGKLLWTVTSGKQSVTLQADNSTLFNVASLTKPVTAEVATLLIEQGEMALDESVTTVWKDDDLKNEQWAEQLTIKHLLSHSSGFANWRSQTEGKLSFIFEPGTQSGYSGEGYQYLAKVMTVKTGKPLDELAEQLLFNPNHIDDVYFVPKKSLRTRLAHSKGPQGEWGQPSVASEPNAADEIFATPVGYANFAKTVMNSWGDSNPLEKPRWQLSFDQSQKICQPHAMAREHCPVAMGFVQGWARLDFKDTSFLLQGGGDWGERAMVILHPETKDALVVLTNGANGMKVVKKVVEVVFQHPSLTAFMAMQAGE